MSHIYDSSIRKPLVIGDKTYHDVTVDVAAPVEVKQTNIGGLYFQSLCLPLGFRLYCLHCVYRNWNMGIKQNSWLGLGYHKLCLVGCIGGTLISAVYYYYSVNDGEWQLTVLLKR
jgi:molybdopterin-containing oxidoreductase family membrane subunit